MSKLAFGKRYPITDENGSIKRSYRKWSSMCRRCSDPSHPASKYYAGKGITVDPRWKGREGYANFVDDMGEPPEGLTLERIDGNKGYSKDNCKWATWTEQANNRIQGGRLNIKPDSIQQKALKSGIPYQVVYQRIKRFAWTEEKALSTPVLINQPSAYSQFIERERLRKEPLSKYEQWLLDNSNGERTRRGLIPFSRNHKLKMKEILDQSEEQVTEKL